MSLYVGVLLLCVRPQEDKENEGEREKGSTRAGTRSDSLSQQSTIKKKRWVTHRKKKDQIKNKIKNPSALELLGHPFPNDTQTRKKATTQIQRLLSPYPSNTHHVHSLLC